MDLNYDEQIKMHRFKKKTITVITVIFIILLGVGTFLYRHFKHYKDYKVVNSVDKENNDNSNFIKYQDGFLKYDNDGITYYNSSNRIIWQQSYEMRKPQVKVCGDYIAIANISSSQVYILDKKGLVKTYDTALPISEIEVSKVGASVVTLEDGRINYVRMFDIKGKMIYDIKKVIEGDGYPLNVTVSDDAAKLCISYLYLDKTVPKTNISFYNFSEVGKNEVEFLVGEYNYEDIIVPCVKFMDNNRVVAVGDKAVIYYEMEQYPKASKRIDFKYKIEKIFFDNDMLAITHKKDGKDTYVIELYNKSGKNKLTYEYDFVLDGICVMKNYVMMYNDEYARMINYLGGTRFEYNFDIPLKSIMWMSGKERFTFVNTKAIQQVILY